ncbi:DUF11 domain-containing protein [Candidatus Micrarchaeota archaeon]|nr:DUF11 domain-containing protein [Candidatus Micrarchaeota archaeon]
MCIMNEKTITYARAFLFLFVFSSLFLCPVYGADVDVSKPVQLTFNDSYERNPTAFMDDSGRYWVFYARGDTCTQRNGCDPDNDAYMIYYKYSDDGGTTWSPPVLLNKARPTNFNQRDLSAFEDESGTIWVFASSGDSGTCRALFYYTTDDGGATWSDAAGVALEGIANDSNCAPVSGTRMGHSHLFYSNGLIHLVYQSSGGSKIYYSSSNDSGANWSAPIEVYSSGHYVPKILESSGQLYIVTAKGADGQIWLANSSDDGATWSTKQIAGSNSAWGDWDPTISRLPDSKLLVVWAPNIGSDGQQLKQVYSSDDGATWSDARDITAGRYGSAEWWDYWPDILPGTNNYFFFSSEHDSTGTAYGSGNIWMYDFDWDMDHSHYDTITGAIGNATDGSTIEVAAGNYSEALLINGFNGLTINGSPGTIVTGGASMDTSFGARDCVVLVNSSFDVLLGQLDIEGRNLGSMQGGTNEKSYAVVYDASSGEISDSIVSPNNLGDPDATGIALWLDSNLTVNNSVIKKYGRVGIFGYSWDINCSAKIYDSILEGPAYPGTNDSLLSYGIESESLLATCSFEIIGNDIYNHYNGPGGYGQWGSAGIAIDGYDESYAMDLEDSIVVIEQNNIYDNEEGIAVATNNLSYARNNNIYDNLLHGAISINISAAPYVKVFNATGNYWGAPDGPNGTTNTGLGDRFTDAVDVCPFLDANYPGGNPSTCHIDAACRVVKTVSDYFPETGDNITFILNISNTGRANLTIYANDTLPAALQFLQASPANTSSQNNTVFWDAIFTSLSPGESRLIEYNATVLSTEKMRNTAEITGVPDSGDNATAMDSVLLWNTPSSGGSEPDEELSAEWNLLCPENIIEFSLESAGEEIPNAEVHFQHKVSTAYLTIETKDTDSEGKAQFSIFKAGTYRILASKSGYEDLRETFSTSMCPGCSADSDCPEGHICEQSACIPPECTDDADCPEVQVCKNWTCIEAPQCISDADCGDLCLVCSNSGTCIFKNECTSDSDCPEGDSCIDCICTASAQADEEYGDEDQGTQETSGQAATTGEEKEVPQDQEAGLQEEFKETLQPNAGAEGSEQEPFLSILSRPLECLPWAILLLLFAAAVYYFLQKSRQSNKRE